ncbi:MAG: helix-turn-helix domain-containing protein, partial [Lapillicoccus sp.]
MLRATQDLLIKDGFERLTMDAVAKRCGASKAIIYRRWPGTTALVAAAAADLFQTPELPDTGDLREDLLACGRTYVQARPRPLTHPTRAGLAARAETFGYQIGKVGGRRLPGVPSPGRTGRRSHKTRSATPTAAGRYRGKGSALTRGGWLVPNSVAV